MSGRYVVQYPSNGDISTLEAYNMDEAREFARMFPLSIIVCRETGGWMNEPLCLDHRLRLAEAHGFVDSLSDHIGSTRIALRTEVKKPYQELISVWNAAKEYLEVASELIPDHIATDSDHNYGRKEDALRKALSLK